MKTLPLKIIAFAISAACTTHGMAEDLTKAKYKIAKENIATTYKTEKTACGSMAGNAKDICVEEAKAKEKIAKADLELQFAPSVKTTYKARIAKAEAEYSVDKERCDDASGNAKDVCVKEAKAKETTAIADAKAAEKTSDAKATSNEKISDARKEAADDKAGAQYKLATEKCDSQSGAAKDKCVADAKLQYGK